MIMLCEVPDDDKPCDDVVGLGVEIPVEEFQKREKINKKFFFLGCVLGTFIIFAFGFFTFNKMSKEVIERKVNQEVSLREIISTMQPTLDPEITNLYIQSIIKYSKEFGFKPEFVASMIMRSSGFNQIAQEKRQNGMIRVGPMQVVMETPGTFSLYYIDTNIKTGCETLKKLLVEKKGNIKEALIAYIGESSDAYVMDILQLYTESTIVYGEK